MVIDCRFNQEYPPCWVFCNGAPIQLVFYVDTLRGIVGTYDVTGDGKPRHNWGRLCFKWVYGQVRVEPKLLLERAKPDALMVTALIAYSPQVDPEEYPEGFSRHEWTIRGTRHTFIVCKCGNLMLKAFIEGKYFKGRISMGYELYFKTI